MPHFSTTAASFPAYLGLNGERTVYTSALELSWAAVSVGRPGYAEIFQHGPYSAFEFVYRLFLMHANLREDENGHIEQSPAYKTLDPSEKGAVSYFVGMSMCKLLAARWLGVPWLAHLDVYREHLTPLVLQSDRRPDLVGHDAGLNWIVMESKGRTHSVPALDTAKEQAKSLTLIQGQVPAIYIACGSGYRTGLLNIRMEDPPPQKADGDGGDEPPELSLEMPDGDFMRAYYKPVLDLLNGSDREDVTIEGRRLLLATLAIIDFRVGLDAEVYEVLTSSRDDGSLFARVRSALPTVPQRLLPREGRHRRQTPSPPSDHPASAGDIFVGGDGIAVAYSDSSKLSLAK